MKFSTFSLLPLAASALSVPTVDNLKKGLNSRQLLPFNFDPYASLPELSVVRTQKLAPKLRKDAKRMRITWGPVTAYSANDERVDYNPGFPSGDADNPADTMWQQIIPGIPSDTTLLWGKIDIADRTGKPITADDGIYLHHIQLFQTNSAKVKKEFCFGTQPFGGLFTPKTQANVVIGAGSSDYEPGFMFTSADAKMNAGYYVDDSARFMMSSEMINYHPQKQMIYPTLEIEYLDGKPAGLMDSSIMLFSVTGCSVGNPTLEFLPDEGVTKFNYTSTGFPLPEDGYIINTLGHIHDGGERVVSRLNGKLICDSVATYGHPKAKAAGMPMGGGHEAMEGMALGLNETIVSMSNCANVIPVRKGDIVTLTAYFDLEKHGGRSAAGTSLGEMATTTMYFAPRAGAAGASEKAEVPEAAESASSEAEDPEIAGPSPEFPSALELQDPVGQALPAESEAGVDIAVEPEVVAVDDEAKKQH